MADERGGLYSISVVARLTGLHEQTIRQYERLGLVMPRRTPGGTRSFSEADLLRLRHIASLTRELGVNLAGVEVILRLREHEERMLALMREIFAHLDEETRSRFEAFFSGSNEPGLVPVPKPQMARVEPPDEQPGGKRRIEIKGG
jgi:MerR family transcriptional regulator/heat shock protein HspR